ncbi:MAG: response regulator, partial [Clostridia bacterium]|nr:response regulator [Clostridia bacterium]
LLFLAGMVIFLRVRLTMENHRFVSVLGDTFESVAELNLSEQVWYEYYILNNTLCRSQMPETMNEYIQRMARERIYRDDVEAYRDFLKPEALAKVAKDRQPIYLELRMMSQTGSYYWCNLLAQGGSPRRRGPATVMLYQRNIDPTRRALEKNMEQTAQALRNAEQANRIKTDFMSRISHELRTPLNVIMGFLSIALQNLQDVPKLTYCLNKADEASHHMLTLVSNMLDISVIEHNRPKVQNSPFQLKELIGNLGSVLFEQARQKKVDFTIRMESVSEEFLIGDPLHLTQILRQLVDNAIKFTPAGGHVCLCIRQTALREDSVHMSFVVTDDGIGMKEGYIDRIFTPFEQEESGDARRYQGSGLGLPLVKNLVDTLGGSLDVTSTLGEGTTFTVNLPFGINRYPVADEYMLSALAELKVLLVDDHHSSLEYISMLLKKLGVNFSTAISGDVALQKAQQAKTEGHPFQLYLIDWVMPGMSGRETITQLLDTVDPEAHIVVITGYDQQAIRAEAEGLPIQQYLMKPLFQSTLLDLLGEMIGRKGMSQQPASNEPLDLHGNRVLLVEDNELNRDIATEFLSTFGMVVETAQNGQEAFDAYLSHPEGYYQLVLMDIQMPIMDGYDATRAIRSSRRNDATTLPIVAMTANAFPEDISRSLASGMNDHISKPIDLARMQKTLAKFVSAR